MAASRDEQQLLSVGSQCSHASCMLVDFLPIKCQHCQKSFCRDHFMYNVHECPNYDPSKFERIAPNCPLCNDPVSFKPGTDPNVAMEAHFNKDCTAMTGKPKTRNNPVCARARCGKTLFAPIRCNKCSQQFCPAHRFPADHACSTPSAQSKTSGPTAASRLLDLNSKASVAGAATVGAIKNLASSAQATASRAPQATKPGIQTPNMPNLFSKTDRSASPSTNSNDPPAGVLVNINSKPVADETKYYPEPIIRPLSSFVPPPIFASA